MDRFNKVRGYDGVEIGSDGGRNLQVCYFII